jgi:hypothetical protein
VSSVPAGWYRDPTGHSEHRYWDGTTWTEHVARAGVQSTDEISGDYAPPAPPSPWPALPAPTQRRWPWVLAGIGVSLILLVGGCTAILVLAVKDTARELNAAQRRHAITQKQFDSIELGTAKEAVIAMLGKQPQDTQEFLRKDVVNADEIRSSCIYYNRINGEFGDRYQFCFEGSVLRSKGSL